MICTNTTNSNGLIIKNRYEVTYKNKYVTVVKTEENIITSDIDVLEEYKKILESMYGSYNELEYYSNKISIKDDTLTSITKIDYSNINKSDLVAIDRNNSKLYDGDKVLLNKVKSIYNDMGARCRIQ